jgi:hypothetical protein
MKTSNEQWSGINRLQEDIVLTTVSETPGSYILFEQLMKRNWICVCSGHAENLRMTLMNHLKENPFSGNQSKRNDQKILWYKTSSFRQRNDPKRRSQVQGMY